MLKSARRWSVWLVALVLVGSALAACGGGGGDGEEGEPAGPVDFVVHTGPGGGSDEFARALAKIMRDEGLIDSNWPVLNVSGGSGAAAMAYMAARKGAVDTVAAMTPTWIATPLTTEEVSIRVDDLTPIVQLVTEPQVMAVRADSPYQSLKDFVDAALDQPGALKQSGGSVTAADALAVEVLKAETGAKWGFLSFEGGGERIAALLGGDADMMVSEPSDFTEHVEAGALRVIATIGTKRSPLFPDAPTLSEDGFDVDVPEQFRGIIAPPGIGEETISYYEDLFADLIETDGWKQYIEDNGLATEFKGSSDYKAFLKEQEQFLTELLRKLDLLVEED